MDISKKDIELLKETVDVLENPNLAIKLSNFLGKPIEGAMKMLPKDWNKSVAKIVDSALTKALNISVSTLSKKENTKPSNLMHKIMAGASGGLGGFLGLSGLAIELPVSTAIMLRSIANIAISEGEDLSDLDSRLECISVFALGGGNKASESAETGYYAVRVSITRSVSEAADFILKTGVVDESGPAIVRFIAQIAARFNIVISEKTAVQLLPAAGALGGAAINLLFINHFQDVAWAHFTIRRLERKYGVQEIEQAYSRILSNIGKS